MEEKEFNISLPVGKPSRGPDKIPVLAPIHVDAMPYHVKKVKRLQTPEEYWEDQSPHVLQWMCKRLNAFIVYCDAGVHDPLGREVFKLLGKEIVSTVRQSAAQKKKKGEGGMSDRPEGQSVKAFRKQLVKMRNDLTGGSETITHDNAEAGNYQVLDDDSPLVSDLPDEF